MFDAEVYTHYLFELMCQETRLWHDLATLKKSNDEPEVHALYKSLSLNRIRRFVKAKEFLDAEEESAARPLTACENCLMLQKHQLQVRDASTNGALYCVNMKGRHESGN